MINSAETAPCQPNVHPSFIPVTIAGSAAELERRTRCPGRRRRALGRRLRIAPGAWQVGAPLRFDKQSMQAKEPRIIAVGHAVEGALRRWAVTGQLGGLRREQQRERLVRRDPIGLLQVTIPFTLVILLQEQLERGHQSDDVFLADLTGPANGGIRGSVCHRRADQVSPTEQVSNGALELTSD